MQLIKPGRMFDFMKYRPYFVGLSLALAALSVIFMFVPGPKWGTDFKGGTELQVVFKKPVEPSDVREAIEKAGFESAEVVRVEDVTHGFIIRVQEVSSLDEPTKEALRDKLCFSDASQQDEARCPDALRPTEVKFSPGGDKISLRYDTDPDRARIAEEMASVPAVKLRGDVENSVIIFSGRDHKVEVQLKSKGDQLLEGLKSHLGEDVAPDAPERLEWIGPKAGAELRNSAFFSIVITIVFIMLYIVIRFDLRFAPGAIFALVHDVVIAVGAMCLLQREITLSTVAAVLTVLGFSVTDTVVVYDRVRENLGKHRNMTFAEIVNLSVSEMFARTLLTSGTVLLSMICFLWFGTQMIKDFAFVILVGVGVGTYSSIYVAAPLTEWIDRRFFLHQTKPKIKPSRQRAQKRADAVV